MRVVRVLSRVVDNGRHNDSLRRTVTSQLVGDQSPRRTTLAFEQLAKEAPRRSPITACLHQDVDHVAVLIHRTPQILPLTADGDEDLVEMPSTAEPTLPSLQLRGVLRTELLTPLANRFVGDEDCSLCQEIFDIAETQGEPKVQPHGMADDLRRKSISAIYRRRVVHRPSLPVARPS